MTFPLAASLVLALLGGPNDEGPVEGPTRPPPATQTPSEVPAPTIEPPEPGIEFAVPPPESESETEGETDTEDAEPTEATYPLEETWPDPGTAPNDGNAMLVLGTATLSLAGTAVGLGLTLGLNDKVPLNYLLPATIIPATLGSAFGVGALYVGGKRARAYRQWEIGYRVVGEPQGGGLMYGGMISALGALALIPFGVRMLAFGDNRGGTTLVALGSAAALATPILLAVGRQRSKRYARTGGWHRRPLPPIPEPARAGLQITPLVAPTLGGFMLGASGRF